MALRAHSGKDSVKFCVFLLGFRQLIPKIDRDPSKYEKIHKNYENFIFFYENEHLPFLFDLHGFLELGGRAGPKRSRAMPGLRPHNRFCEIRKIDREKRVFHVFFYIFAKYEKYEKNMKNMKKYEKI